MGVLGGAVGMPSSASAAARAAVNAVALVVFGSEQLLFGPPNSKSGACSILAAPADVTTSRFDDAHKMKPPAVALQVRTLRAQHRQRHPVAVSLNSKVGNGAPQHRVKLIHADRLNGDGAVVDNGGHDPLIEL